MSHGKAGNIYLGTSREAYQGTSMKISLVKVLET